MKTKSIFVTLLLLCSMMASSQVASVAWSSDSGIKSDNVAGGVSFAVYSGGGITLSGGCQANLTSDLSINDFTQKPDYRLHVYPNPTMGISVINVPMGTMVYVYDTRGVKVSSIVCDGILNIENLLPGTYIVDTQEYGRTLIVKS